MKYTVLRLTVLLPISPRIWLAKGFRILFFGLDKIIDGWETFTVLLAVQRTV